MEIVMENVRCFLHAKASVKPLTLLIGDNSTGKSTFLAMTAALSGNDVLLALHPFNREPYNLGSFDSLATYKGGRFGRAGTFTIGFNIQKAGPPRSARFTYSNLEGLPFLTSYQLTAADIELTGSLSVADKKFKCLVKIGTRSQEFSGEHTDFRIPIYHAISSVLYKNIRDLMAQGPVPEVALDALYSPYFWTIGRSSSVAPVRTKPRRTYETLGEEPNPEGEHIPRLLARILGDEKSSKTQEMLREWLESFGKDSTLFSTLKIRRLGSSPSDPFKILIRNGGPGTNIIDVGYGVSQALPVVVETVLLDSSSRLLIQQPEVHLHPRAQAAVGTLLSRVVASGKKQIIVETHSDYLVDRVRLAVAGKVLKPEDVSILFFHRKGTDTTIFPIELDSSGNLLKAPPTYREFFLREQEQLLLRAQN